MSKIIGSKPSSQASLRDDELAAVTGGMFNAFVNFGDIKGECSDSDASTGSYSKTLTFTLSTTTP